MAEGRSNQSIAAKLHISDKTVEACTGRIFSKLALEPGPDDHRRVRAVLAYLQATDDRRDQRRTTIPPDSSTLRPHQGSAALRTRRRRNSRTTQKVRPSSKAHHPRPDAVATPRKGAAV